MTPPLNMGKRQQERCRATRELISEYTDGELEPDQRRAVERHIRWCPNCRRMLTNLQRSVSGLRMLRDRPTPDE